MRAKTLVVGMAAVMVLPVGASCSQTTQSDSRPDSQPDSQPDDGSANGSATADSAGPHSDGVLAEAATLVQVRRGTLTNEHEFAASVSFGEPWSLGTEASGTVTSDRSAGTIVSYGEELVRVDDKPVFLVAGDMPLFRELRKIDTLRKDENGDRLVLLQGLDVTQLQTFLIERGFDLEGRLEADGEFGSTTEKAVKAWQTSVGHSPTGRIDTTQMVFSPVDVRLTVDLRAGDRFDGLQVAKSKVQIFVDTSNRDRLALKIGEGVQVELVDGVSFVGLVVEQEQVDAGGQRVWRTTIESSELLDGDVTTATVAVTEVVADDVLIVPVGALLALAEGGFAVEVAVGGSTTLVAVEVGAVVEGQAEVLGIGAAESDSAEGGVVEGGSVEGGVVEGGIVEGDSVVVAT